MLPQTYNQLLSISSEYRDPNRSLWLMREYMNNSVTHTKAAAVKNNIERFCKAGISLKDVCDLAQRLTNKMEVGRGKCSAQEKIK